MKEANAAFYSALNMMFRGDIAPMDAVWSHADDVTYMGPDGGYQVGWDAVRADWDKQSAMQLGGEVTPTKIHINEGETIAVVSCIEQGKNLKSDGKPEDISLRATNIFRKENGQWKMIGHHTDKLPSLFKASALACRCVRRWDQLSDDSGSVVALLSWGEEVSDMHGSIALGLALSAL